MSWRTRVTRAFAGRTAPRADPVAVDQSQLGTYQPENDGEPDPGEIVWAWVAYEDDPSQGKDRPVLIIDHDGDEWLGLILTSQDHDRDAADEARFGRYWMDIGSGAWDRQGRPSEVRLDRILRVDAASVRREGATLDRGRFDQVIAAVRDLGAQP